HHFEQDNFLKMSGISWAARLKRFRSALPPRTKPSGADAGVCTMSCLSGKSFVVCLSLLTVALVAGVPATAQVVSTDFEDGTTDGWTGFAGAQVAVSTTQANTGTYSLLTTARSQLYQGPSIDLTQTLTPGQ